jgi:hypothetical protein
MGIEIPDELRGEMAVAGQWTTVSQTAVPMKQEEDTKSSGPRFSEHKRKHEDEDDEEEDQLYQRKGLSKKVYPGSKGESEDLDALLSGIIPKKEPETVAAKEEEQSSTDPVIKEEELQEETAERPGKSGASVKSEENAKEEVKRDDALPGAGIVFKKRKKPIRPV